MPRSGNTPHIEDSFAMLDDEEEDEEDEELSIGAASGTEDLARDAMSKTLDLGPLKFSRLDSCPCFCW